MTKVHAEVASLFDQYASTPILDTSLTFTVWGVAQPKGSMKAFMPKGWTRPILTSTNRNVKGWQQLVAEACGRARDENGAELLEGPVRLLVAFYMPRPKSLAKRVVHHTKKPDLDKLVRSVADSLTATVFRDDSQVCELVAVKHYAADQQPPRVDICVEPTAGTVPLAREQPLFAGMR